MEYKLHFNGLLDRYSALLARDAKRLKAEQAEQPEPSQLPLQLPSSRLQAKAALSTRILQARGVAAARPAPSPQPSAMEQTG